MTNKILFIANWKMFGDLKSIKSIKSVINISKKKRYRKAKIIYCPPFTLLNNFAIKTKKSTISIGAQNCHQEKDPGPFTGSISSSMIKKIGAVEKVLEVYIGPFFGGAIEGWAPYVLAIFFLLYRPEGLFGEKIIRRV